MLSAGTRVLLFALFFFSGATGLVYELVWTRQLIFVFGGTTYAITTVLVAFMGGLGLGSYLAGRVSRRLGQPGVAYGVLEIAIGLYALSVPFLLSLAEPAYRAMYPHVAEQPGLLTAARFAVGSVVLLAPTTMMGATLPLLVRYLTGPGGLVGRNVAVLYGTNSIGAVAGVLASGFLLMPALGLAATTQLAAAANIVIGLIGVVRFRQPASASAPGEATAKAAARAAKPRSGRAGARGEGKRPALADMTPFPAALRRAALVVFAVSGFAAMVYQVAWTRSLVTSLGSSTYSFTCILAAFILGIAIGSFGVARTVDHYRNPPLIIGGIQLGIGLLAVLILPIYGRIPYVAWVLATQYGSQSFDHMLALQLLFTILITVAPTVLMGAMFPLVTRTAVAGARDEGAATGRAYGANTLGTILGAFCGGFVLLATIGVRGSVITASLLNAASGAVLLYLALPRSVAAGRRLGAAAAGLGGVALCAAAVGALDRWDPRVTESGAFLGATPPGEQLERTEVLYYDEGVDLNVLVGRSKDNVDGLYLTVNGKTDASTGTTDVQTQLLTGHLPALLSPRRERVCVVGLGCGMTLAAVARHAEVGQLDCVEISDGVIEAARLFNDVTYHVLERDARVRLFRADGRNHLLLTDQRYDLIISQPSNPWIAGVSNLFTREYFELCRSRLTDEGSLFIWMQGYQMTNEHFRLIVRTLAGVFEHVSLWEMSDYDFGLLARRAPARLPLSEVQRRFEQPPVRSDLYRAGRGRLWQVLGAFRSSGEPLRQWAAGPGVHTDDNAILEFAAPRYLYMHKGPEILAGLLEIQRSPLDECVQNDLPPAQAARIERGIHDVRRSRLIRYEGRLTSLWEDPFTAIAAEVESYRWNPGSLIPLHQLRELVWEIRTAGREDLLAHPRFKELMAELETIPAPFLPDPRGATLDEIAAFFKQRAAEVLERGQWQVAVAHLREARELAPNDADIIVQLAEALLAGGERDAAADVLADALRRGQLEREALASHAALLELIDAEPGAALDGG